MNPHGGLEDYKICGLVGVAGNISLPVERMFKRLLELDTTRGPHSTGIFALKSDKKTVLAKAIGTPWDLAETKGADEVFRGVARVLIGHNRWATKGKINKHNAHPFEFDNLAGAHNGTLRSVMALDDYQQFDVDSENIYHHMNRHGVYDTIPKLNGAFALTWYDKVGNTMNLIRNEERTLFYAFSEDMKTLAWASEEWMLMVASSQCSVELGAIQRLPIGVLHTFEIPQYSADKFEKGRTRALELHKAPVYNGQFFPKDEDKKKVVELRPKEAGHKEKKTIVDYANYLGEDVLFYVGQKAVTAHNQPYIQCWCAEDESISIRVFAQEGGSLWQKMMSSTNHFTGIAKSYNEQNGGYLSIDLRTVLEVFDSTADVPEETVAGYQGEQITEDEFDERTKKGCAWCSCHVDVKDAADVKWISKDDFICPDCADQDEVKQYLIKH